MQISSTIVTLQMIAENCHKPYGIDVEKKGGKEEEEEEEAGGLYVYIVIVAFIRVGAHVVIKIIVTATWYKINHIVHSSWENCLPWEIIGHTHTLIDHNVALIKIITFWSLPDTGGERESEKER